MPDREQAEGVAGRRIALVLATSTGGVGRHVRSLAARLTAGGAEVAVLGPAATETLFGFSGVSRFTPVEIAAGLRPLADLGAASRLRRLLARADVVHAHGLRAGAVVTLALTGRHGPGRPPLVVTWHNLVLGGGAARGVILGPIERQVARAADVTLAVSDDLVVRARAVGAPDARTALVAAPPRPRVRGGAPVRAGLGIDTTTPLVVAVGRLHPQKGFDVLIDAAAMLARRQPTPLVVIAGDGPCRRRLDRKVRESGAPVRLLGHRDDVGDLLAAADVVAMPSRWEGWPLAAAETLAAGRPLVATSVGGLPTLAGDAAVIVAPDDPTALAGAIGGLLDDPSKADTLARRASGRAASWPDEDAVAEHVTAVYRELWS